MNTTTWKRTLTGLFLALFAITMAACDANSNADDEFDTLEVQDLFTSVSSELSLTTSQQAQFAASLKNHDHGDRTPGYLWIVADSLSQTLTDEQKAELLSRTPFMEGADMFRGLHGFPGGGEYYGVGGFMGASSHHGMSPEDVVLNLTAEQQTQLQAIHDTYRTEFKALAEAHRGGTITDEDFITQMRALHEAKRADIEAVLTADQLAALADFRADREADFEAFRAEVKVVRDNVLGLTASESETFDNILADQLEAREILMEQFQAGDLSPAALNDEIEALMAAKTEALMALLSDGQYEVVQIHDALTVRVGKKGHRGKMGHRK